MTTDSFSKAEIPNPALADFNVMIGEWNTVGKHPMMPNEKLHGKAIFKWIEGGAFLMMKAAVDHKDFPAGVAIFGSDEESDEYSMIYFDERKVSRKYTATLKGKVLKWWRNDPEFSQRFTHTISEDGNTMVSKGEMSRKGGPWEGDLEMTFTRIR